VTDGGVERACAWGVTATQVTARDLLTGAVPPPEEAQTLYQALRLREHRLGNDGADSSVAAGPTPPAKDAPVAAAAAAAAPAAASRPSTVRAKALFDFAAQQPGDLGFAAGDVLEITERTSSQNDWWKGRLNGKVGSFPANYVQLL
jgi:hypothetical protein